MNIDVQIDPQSGVPLYRQIADEVKAARLRGYLTPGQRLPSVREMAKALGLNPTTVVKAYDLLANERVITRRQGQGAFVADGDQPLHPGERQALLGRLAEQLAIEGRRLGCSETELLDLLREHLAALRPSAAAAQSTDDAAPRKRTRTGSTKTRATKRTTKPPKPETRD